MISRPRASWPRLLPIVAGQDSMTKSRSIQGLFRPSLRMGTMSLSAQFSSHTKSQGQPRLRSEPADHLLLYEVIILQRMWTQEGDNCSHLCKQYSIPFLQMKKLKPKQVKLTNVFRVFQLISNRARTTHTRGTLISALFTRLSCFSKKLKGLKQRG